jgi:hypothetical protein
MPTRGDYDTAIGEWLKVARSPSGEVHPAIQSEACYAIAMLFWIGQGVPQDTSVAAGWLEQAAKMNHAGAQTKLGYLYSAGQGVPQSDFESLKWFRMAANQGDPDAQYNLGVMYRDGLGVAPDPELSLQWFREAAANGDPVSAGVVAELERSENVVQLPGADASPLKTPTLVAVDELALTDPEPGFKRADEPASYETRQLAALMKVQQLRSPTRSVDKLALRSQPPALRGRMSREFEASASWPAR